MALKMFPWPRSVPKQLCDGFTFGIHVDLVEPMRSIIGRSPRSDPFYMLSSYPFTWDPGHVFIISVARIVAVIILDDSASRSLLIDALNLEIDISKNLGGRFTSRNQRQYPLAQEPRL